MPDEPTAWELARNYQQLRADMRDGFSGMNTRLDKLPSGELVTSLIAALEHRVQEAEAKVRRLEQERSADRRVVISATLVGIVSIIVSVVSPLLTGGS